MKVCVVGHERSGTSAISILLSKATGWSLLDDPPESWYLTPVIYITGSGLTLRMWWRLRTHDIVKVPRFAAILSYLRKCLVGGFTTLYCVRDPRDTVASVLERLNYGYSTLFTDTTWLGIRADTQAEAIAWRWRKYLETALRYQQQGGRVFYIRYEDFCQDRVTTLKEFALEIGAPFNAKRIEYVADAQFRKAWDSKIVGPGRWQDELDLEDVVKIVSICGSLMSAFGYKVDTSRDQQAERALHDHDQECAVAGKKNRARQSIMVNPRARAGQGGSVVRSEDSPILCIVTPNKGVYSETFIQAHIERLPAQVRVLYSKSHTPSWDDGSPLLPRGLLSTLGRAARHRFLGLEQQDFRATAIKRFLLRNGIGVVLAEYGLSGLFVLDACRDAGIPLVVHFHGYEATSNAVLDRNGQRYRELFYSAGAIVAASESMKNQLISLGAQSNKIYINPYGVDTSLFQPSDLRFSPRCFLAVGRFVDKKSPHLTLIAFKEVVQRFPDARLIMVGDGPLLEACKQLSRALEISSAVEFRGPQTHPEVALSMRNVRAFVQHSMMTTYGDSESLGVVFLEAGASGLPAIGTRHDGIPEVVLDGKTGYLVNEGDVHSMASRMIQLAEDPDLAHRLGRAARERIEQHFSMEKSISGLWRIIKSAIEL